MNSFEFAHNIWLQIVSLLALHLPNWHLHPQCTTVVFCCQHCFSGSLICLCETSWGQNCNQIMRVEQSMMVSNCDGMMRSTCWCLLACYRLWRHSCTVPSMTNWFSWSLRRATEIHSFSNSLYISGIVPVTASKKVWDHIFTSIQMEIKFTFTLCTDIYNHQNLGQIKFPIQCSARPLLLHTILCCIPINQCSQYDKTCVHYFIQCCPCSEMHLVIQLCSISCSSFLIWSSEYSWRVLFWSHALCAAIICSLLRKSQKQFLWYQNLDNFKLMLLCFPS